MVMVCIALIQSPYWLYLDGSIYKVHYIGLLDNRAAKLEIKYNEHTSEVFFSLVLCDLIEYVSAYLMLRISI